MPSRAEVTDLSARLARIEAVVMAQAGITPPERPKPKRMRKAPAKR